MNTSARQQVVSTDLFGSGTEKYPHAPGFKKTATSKAAAKSIAVYATTKRHDVLMAFVAAGERGLTPDVCAKGLNLSVLTTRPRCTELVSAGLLVPTGERRQNQSGMSAAVLKASEAGIRAAKKNGGSHE
jgi:hypothetical protein